MTAGVDGGESVLATETGPAGERELRVVKREIAREIVTWNAGDGALRPEWPPAASGVFGGQPDWCKDGPYLEGSASWEGWGSPLAPVDPARSGCLATPVCS